MSSEVETMAYAGEVPWHGSGKPVPNDLTAHQMLCAAGLAWTVEKIPAYIDYQDKRVDIPRAALVRSSDGKVLDTVPKKWVPLQNEEAFDFFKDFVMKGDMEMHTAGSLKGGQIVWALARVKEGFFVGKDDEIQSHLLFTNPHQFGKSIDIRFTPIRVVCWNTLCMALGSAGLTVDQQVVRATHRKPFDSEKVLETLGLAHDLLDEYKNAAQFIATKRFTSEKLNQYFAELFPKDSSAKDPAAPSRNHRTALEIINTQPGARIQEGSWWQAFNAVTFMTDHRLGRATETRLESAWFGSNRKLKSLALNRAVEMAQDSGDLITT
jgi:phage/plasmid-like protein (TIGR03299 family)